MSKEKIEELVDSVREDVAKQLKYQLSDEQLDELRLTGRVGIAIDDFIPSLQYLVAYLNNTQQAHSNWTVSLNAISLDLEISLPGSSIAL